MTDLPIPDHELDIRGEICPYTYVKTRLALENMATGQVLRVVVDYEPATHSIPRSLKIQGDELLDLQPCGPSQWALLIRKVG